MPLTPLDAEKVKFRSGFRGYAREEVERFRATVVAALEDHIARSQQLAARVAELEGQLAHYQEKEELLKSSIVLAQRTCDELIAAAHQKADAIRREALLEGDEVRRELAELRSQREQFEYAFHGLLAGFLHRLEQGNPRLAAGRSHPQLAGGQPQEGAAGQPGEDLPAPATEEQGATAAPPAEPAATPAPRRQPPPPTGRPKAAAEVDRDGDILDFSAALDNATAPEPEWLSDEQKPPEELAEQASPAEADDEPVAAADAAEPEADTAAPEGGAQQASEQRE